jgi:hypothetical protein
MIHDFTIKLDATRGERQRTDEETIAALLPGCISVVKTDEATDRAGVDYIATLRRGARVLIDGKMREPGASKWWFNGEPELPLEIYSVVPGTYSTNPNYSKTGWTLDEATAVDLILFTFDPSDTKDVYLLPFQHLRTAFRQQMEAWKKQYPRNLKEQESRARGITWRSQALFMPATTVIRAIEAVSRGQLMRPLFRAAPLIERLPFDEWDQLDTEIDAHEHARRFFRAADND